MNFIDTLKEKLSLKVQLIILVVLILFSTFQTFYDYSSYINVANNLLPKLLIGLAIIYLLSQQKGLSAHLVLLLTLFSGYFYHFVASILSFQLNMGIFLKQINVFDIVGVLISIYLVLMIISYAKAQEKFELDIKVEPLMIGLALYLYIRFGFEYSLAAFALMLIFVISKSRVPLYLFMLSYVIHIPFFIIDLIFDRIGFYLTSYWFYAMFGFVILILVVIKLIKALNQEEAY